MPKVVKVQHHGKTRWRVIVPPIAGEKRKVRFFKSKDDAAMFASGLAGKRDDTMLEFMKLPQVDRGRLLHCLERIGGIANLESAVDALARSKATLTKPLTDAIKECVAAKEQAKRSWQYVENLTVALTQFAAGRETRSTSEITSTEIEGWLHGNNWSASTQTTYLRRLETFFAWAVKRGYAAADPTQSVEKPDDVGGPIVVLPVDDCRRLLETCRRIDPKLLPYFAIGLFAGIRPDEVKRLSAESVRGEWIHIEAAKAKTRRRRLVEIHPTLAAWLALGGEIGWRNWRRRFRAVVTEAKLTWTKDVMRHSFCSYAYPLKGAQWVSAHAGHSEQTLFRNYRELVTLEAAREFWSITPESITKSPAAST